MVLQVNLEKLGNIRTSLVGIGGKPLKVEGFVDLPITLRKRARRRMVRQSFMVARIDGPVPLILTDEV